MSFYKNVIQPVVDCWSLFVGLKVTGKYLVGKNVTVHYPRETVDREVEETFGGHIELVAKPKDPEMPKCISCMMCVTVCPSKCLTVVKQKAPALTAEQEEEKKRCEEAGEKFKKPKAPKNPAKFNYDYSLCSLCGTCIENCPVNSLKYSNNIYFVGTSRKEFKLDLLARLNKQASAAQAPAAEKEA